MIGWPHHSGSCFDRLSNFQSELRHIVSEIFCFRLAVFNGVLSNIPIILQHQEHSVMRLTRAEFSGTRCGVVERQGSVGKYKRKEDQKVALHHG